MKKIHLAACSLYLISKLYFCISLGGKGRGDTLARPPSLLILAWSKQSREATEKLQAHDKYTRTLHGRPSQMAGHKEGAEWRSSLPWKITLPATQHKGRWPLIGQHTGKSSWEPAEYTRLDGEILR